MRVFLFLIVASLLVFAGAQISVTGGDKTVFSQGMTIKPGTFGDEDFTLIVSSAKKGGFSVDGYLTDSGTKRKITGSMTKSGVLRANMKMGSGNARVAPVDGRYDSVNDILLVTSIDGKATQYELPRFGVRLIKVGTYSGRSAEPETAWEISVSKSSGRDFNVTGFVEINGTKKPIKGTLKGGTGKLLGSAVDADNLLIEGAYDFKAHEITIDLRISGSPSAISATLAPGRLTVPQLFGLVEKIPGKIPDEAEAADFKISGIQSENSFQVDIIMKPPYEGRARVKNEYSSQLTATLKVGDVLELTAISTSDKSGSYQPNLSISGFWLVEGDGAEVLEFTKTFAGTASDGKFYASSQGKTRFRVLNKGTIRITAVYTGHYWGPGGDWKWNPCTYVYKFKEAPKLKIGG